MPWDWAQGLGIRGQGPGPDTEPRDHGTEPQAWDRAQGSEPKDQGAGIRPAKHRKQSFFAPGIDAIHPQLSLRTQKPYTVAVWQSCSEMQHRCA